MRIKVDLESNALYLRLSESAIKESEEVHSGLIIDYDAEGHIVGLEILNIKEQFKIDDLIGLKLELPTTLNTSET
ncbi:MAG: hypothetical protein RBG13Loki_1608 [Promethearchaeota archaeon CR_4]|nr:MAG: hypothetical protein RBG13Loki_1608 [Candidatus Lokiarchaeota archaeon CR_4]